MRVLGVMAMVVSVVSISVLTIMCGWIAIFDDNIDLGSSEPAAAYLAHLQMSPDVECGRCFFKQGERHARIHKRAKQHVAADAGETL